MRVLFSLLALSALLPSLISAHEQTASAVLLQSEYETKSEWVDGSGSSSSSGGQVLIETYLGETEVGKLYNYDLPRDEDGKSNSNFWYFPAHVVEKSDGSLVLADREGIEKRIDQWLVQRKWPRKLCGRWSHGGGFPYKVDCDPDSILRQIAELDLRFPKLVEGQTFEHPLGKEPAVLQPSEDSENSLKAVFELSTDAARKDEVEQALILAEMLDEDLTREQAEAEALETSYNGSITVEFVLDEAGKVISKTEYASFTVSTPNDGSKKKEARTRVFRTPFDPMTGGLLQSPT